MQPHWSALKAADYAALIRPTGYEIIDPIKHDSTGTKVRATLNAVLKR